MILFEHEHIPHSESHGGIYGGANWVDTAVKLAPVAIPAISKLIENIIPKKESSADRAAKEESARQRQREQDRIDMLNRYIEKVEDPKLRLEYLKLLPK